MNTAFFDPDRDLSYYIDETPNNIRTGVDQLRWAKKRCASRHRVEQKEPGADIANKKRTKKKA